MRAITMEQEPMSSTNFAALYKSVEKSDHTLLVKRYFCNLAAEFKTLEREPWNRTAKMRSLKLIEGLLYGLEIVEETEETRAISNFCFRAMKTIRGLK